MSSSTAASCDCISSAADGRYSRSATPSRCTCARSRPLRRVSTSWRSRASTARPSRRRRWKGCCAKLGSGPRPKAWCSGPSGGPSLPEGDTIWRTAAALRRGIAGKVVSDDRPAAIARLKGRRVESVEPNGKHLLMRFEGGIALHSHMRMTGSWHLYRPGERWRQPAWRATAVLSFHDVVAGFFAAPVMELGRDAHAPGAHLGPDILSHPVDLDAVGERAPPAGGRTLRELVLGQRDCAGI